MRLIRLPEMLAKTGLSRSRAYAAIADGSLPKPVRLGGPNSRAIGFVENEIDDWISARIAEREAA